MTDKPDVAALVARLNARKKGYLGSVLDLINPDGPEAAAELTRLAAERDAAKKLVVDQGNHSIMRRRAEAEARRLSNAHMHQIERAQKAEAEIARLRAFLEPFAESAAYFEVFGIYGGVPVRHLRDARAALKSNTVEKP